MGAPPCPKRRSTRRVRGPCQRSPTPWRPGAHDGERRLAQQELRDAVDHHAPLTVEAILTEGTIDAVARVDLDVRAEQQPTIGVSSLITCCLLDGWYVDVSPPRRSGTREVPRRHAPTSDLRRVRHHIRSIRRHLDAVDCRLHACRGPRSGAAERIVARRLQTCATPRVIPLCRPNCQRFLPGVQAGGSAKLSNANLKRKHRPSELYELPLSDVNWLALWDEFAQAIDNKQLEVAERIVYLDGRLDFTELGGSQLIAAARQSHQRTS